MIRSDQQRRYVRSMSGRSHIVTMITPSVWKSCALIPENVRRKAWRMPNVTQFRGW
jgi:hypothetical protein